VVEVRTEKVPSVLSSELVLSFVQKTKPNLADSLSSGFMNCECTREKSCWALGMHNSPNLSFNLLHIHVGIIMWILASSFLPYSFIGLRGFLVVFLTSSTT